MSQKPKARDASHFRRNIAAKRAITATDAELRAAVEAARAAGDSFTPMVTVVSGPRLAPHSDDKRHK